MKVFQKKYSSYYDFFYKEKDYESEVDFLEKVIKKYSNKTVRSILALGSGTSSHELILANRNYQITGLDNSSAMLQIARQKIKNQGLEESLFLLKRDVRNFALQKKHDLAMAMFNIVGYMNENKDMESLLKSVHKSPKKNALFVFDCWHAAAVLTDRPGNRTRKIKLENSEVLRKTNSRLHPELDIVEIKFEVSEKSKGKIINKTKETHFMRYWTIPELKYFFEKNGFDFVDAFNFLQLGSRVKDDMWDIFVIGRKK